MLSPRSVVAREGEEVVVYHGMDSLGCLVLKRGEVLHCKAGKFRHDDIIGKPLGSYVGGISNRLADPVKPFILILQLSSTLWTQAVPHRTQIIYDTDIAVIILNLRLGPGKRVVEAGTGSGSLTHSIAKVVAPFGTVVTCDFHKERCRQAQEEFKRHFGAACPTLICSQWRDVCSTSIEEDVTFGPSNSGLDAETIEACEKRLEAQEAPRAGFGVPSHSMDAVFLDVPTPWLAVENVLHVLKYGGILCTFSPCIEQTQRLCDQLRGTSGREFVDIRTVEVLTKYFEAGARPRENFTLPLPTAPAGEKRPRTESEEGAEAVSSLSSNKPQNSLRANVAPKLKPCPVSKGHSAYLTFARRRVPFDATLQDKDDGSK